MRTRYLVGRYKVIGVCRATRPVSSVSTARLMAFRASSEYVARLHCIAAHMEGHAGDAAVAHVAACGSECAYKDAYCVRGARRGKAVQIAGELPSAPSISRLARVREPAEG